jgi:hypothetical protein
VEYPTINGTYAGTLSGSSSGPGAAFTLSTKLTEAAFTLKDFVPGITYYYAPLSATMTAQGSSCFTSGGTTSALLLGPVGQVVGDNIALAYTTDTGSTLSVTGHFSDASEKTLMLFGSVFSGKCRGEHISGTLTLQ